MTDWRASLRSSFRIASFACASLAVAAAAHGQGRNPLICEPMPGLGPLLDRYERVMLVADRPGVRELPATFGELACAFSARSPLVVGVEWLTDLQPWLDAYMASDGGEEAQLALVNILDPSPRSDMPNYATIQMLERLRRLAHAGRDVRVLAWLIPELEEMPPPIEPMPNAFDSAFDEFDPDEDLSVPPANEIITGWDIWRANMREPESLEEAREAFMADMIQAISDPRARILILASSDRVRRKPLKSGTGVTYPSFAMTFPPGGSFSLDVRHARGEAWVCESDGCGIRNIPSAGAGEIRMITQSPIQIDGFDGAIHLGPVSVSPPAQPPPPQIAYELYFDSDPEHMPEDVAPDAPADAAETHPVAAVETALLVEAGSP